MEEGVEEPAIDTSIKTKEVKSQLGSQRAPAEEVKVETPKENKSEADKSEKKEEVKAETPKSKGVEKVETPKSSAKDNNVSVVSEAHSAKAEEKHDKV